MNQCVLGILGRYTASSVYRIYFLPLYLCNSEIVDGRKAGIYLTTDLICRHYSKYMKTTFASVYVHDYTVMIVARGLL